MAPRCRWPGRSTACAVSIRRVPRSPGCSSDHRIAAKNCLLTTRAAKWATVQVGGGRTVSEVAAELACDWHTVNDAVTPMARPCSRPIASGLNKTSAIGLDETSFVKRSKRSHTELRHHGRRRGEPPDHRHPPDPQIRRCGGLDRQTAQAPGRSGSASAPSTCRPPMPRCTRVICPRPPRWSTPSMSSLWPIAPRCRAPSGANRTDRAPGPKDDPLYRARRVCCVAKNISTRPPLWLTARLGDPNAEVAIAYRVKERFRDFYRESRTRSECSRARGTASNHAARDPKARADDPHWFDKICNFHLARVTNGPTESLNNLIKRIKRIGFGFRNFENYRIRALLYAGKPNWRVLGSIVVR